MGTRHRLLLKSRKFFEDFGSDATRKSDPRASLSNEDYIALTVTRKPVSRLGMVERLATNPENASSSGSLARVKMRE